ncbi:MAG: type II secretion system protein GspG [Bdellovibrio sp.]|nr:type II secretion system protein GspG [Bdellovibrio sp.]
MKSLKTSVRLSNNQGFSLAEIMIVLVIIGAILGLILPKIQEGRDNGNVRNTKIKLGEIENKLNEYQADCGKLPSSVDFLVTDSAQCKNWTSNKNLKNLLKDEWQNPFSYEVSGNGFNLKSLGRDKKEGGSGPDKDIYSSSSQANQNE